MSSPEILIPIPENAIEVEFPGHVGNYFVNPDPAKPEFTWVQNVLGTDGATYKFSPDEVIITSHSTHDPYHDDVVTVFTNPLKEFWEWQEILQQILDLANAKSA